MNPSQKAIGQWHWVFRPVRGGIDLMNHRFRARFVGLLGVWKYFQSEDGNLYSPDAAGSTNPSRLAISQWGWGFPHRVRRYRPDEQPFSCQVCGTCRCVKKKLILRWSLILRGWRWLHNPQPITD